MTTTNELVTIAPERTIEEGLTYDHMGVLDRRVIAKTLSGNINPDNFTATSTNYQTINWVYTTDQGEIVKGAITSEDRQGVRRFS